MAKRLSSEGDSDSHSIVRGVGERVGHSIYTRVFKLYMLRLDLSAVEVNNIFAHACIHDKQIDAS